MNYLPAKKVLLFFILPLLLVFSANAESIDKILDDFIEEKSKNYLGLSIEAGISIPYFYQPLSVSPALFSGKIDCPALDIDAQARYQISSTNIVISSMFSYGWLGVSSQNMWNNGMFNGMKGSNWSLLAGAGYSFKTKNEKFHFVPSAVIGIRNEKLSGSLQLSSLDTVLLKNSYDYSATDFEAGADFYFMHKFNDLWGISLSVTPLLTFYSTGSLYIKDYIRVSKWDLDCSSKNGSFILDSKLNFVLYW